jgi:trehalose 6-phosphate synthase/phosphatase
MEVYKPGDIIWVHDYHLLLLPELLRHRIGRDAYIGIFVHAPWPSSEIFRTLSHRKPLLEGMLAANMVGFQSQTYKQHFTSCCKRILGKPETYKGDDVTGVESSGSHCAVESLPIGLDINKVLAAAMEPGIRMRMENIRKQFGGRKIIVGRDRLDSVRGVVQKLRAFELFLEKYPKWSNKVRVTCFTTK